MKLLGRFIATMTVSTKIGLRMRHLGKEVKKLKQHFYKLKKIKTPLVVQQNGKNNTHTSQGNKSDKKDAKVNKRKNYPENLCPLF